MLPCTGIPGVAPPLCSWAETKDGTVTLADIQRFNYAIDEMYFYKQREDEQ